jgi:nucleoside-diphosphate-sugar epimerase
MKIEFVRGNLADRTSIARALDSVETVYHLAAGMRGSVADIVLNSVVASRNLLDAVVAAHTPHVVLVSSFSVYGAAGLKPRSAINEETPLETSPEKRDPYAFGKLWQEKLFHEYQLRHGFRLTVLRPGVIYGPKGSAMSSRVGLQLPGVFLRLGGSNVLPLSYVDNCAEAIVLAGHRADGNAVNIYNVHDDDLPTCSAYLHMYRKNVKALRTIPVPYFALMWLSRVCSWYHEYSHGQMPAVFTPYKTAAMWKGNTFDNSKLKTLGWQQIVPTHIAMRQTFEWLRTQSL